MQGIFGKDMILQVPSYISPPFLIKLISYIFRPRHLKFSEVRWINSCSTHEFRIFTPLFFHISFQTEVPVFVPQLCQGNC